MNQRTFRAMIVEETQDNRFVRSIKERSISDLSDGDVLVHVSNSSLNYKDALSATGNRSVTRKYPHTPGIDAAGIVEESRNKTIQKGDAVIVTSYDLGMNTSGGFGQYIRIPADWVVPLPQGLTLKESMIYGTAGFTAGLSVFSLTHTVKPDQGDILVTGATGGVGSITTAILSKLGYHVVAVSGKPDAADFLRNLGARRIVTREEVSDESRRPLLKSAWAGVVDTVGGNILATAIKSTHPWGTVTTCGMVASPDLPLTVFPFILRGIKLIGINSQSCPMKHRQFIWKRLASDWKIDHLETLCREVSLEELNPLIDTILKGGIKGRTVVNLEK
ncbi:MAG: YhdH/YhfP family quinone oxidoreductase [Desulfobacterales bacterium]|nr:YhdH/YhfP family quinone oxidoreductase [Desulfobacterales bacterium]MDX2512728.1 YhdH/YhfP family quinone oxidoreductase [Desulfobacterales bacterium]